MAAEGLSGELTLVHGVPDLLVDITVKGKFFGFKTVVEDVPFETVAALVLGFDKYKVQIRAAGADPKSDPILQRSVWIGIRDKAVVAHLDADGAPTMSKFNNTTFLLEDGTSKVVVRHLAEAPKVDVIANDALTLIDGLKNGKQKSVRVPSDTYNVKVAADADNSVVVFDEDLTFNSGEVTIVYAVGSLEGGSFTVLAQVKDAKYVWGGVGPR